MENNEDFNTDDSFDNDEDFFKYNFVNQPWDDRTDKSKTGIISLLIAIFIVTMAFVINNLAMHYIGYDSNSSNNYEIDCNLIKVDKYQFAARIHSMSTNQMICIGAVLSSVTILANELCLRTGPIIIRLGSINDRRCKKGFSVDDFITIAHNGSLTKTLVLIITKEYIGNCAKSVAVGINIDINQRAFILGRSKRGERTLSFQIADLDMRNMTIPLSSSTLNKQDIICVGCLSKCPVRVGDLLVQDNKLFGISSTSVHRRELTKVACFAKISVIHQNLKSLDLKINFV